LFQLTGANGCGKTNALRVLGKTPQLATCLFPLSALSGVAVRSTAVGFQAGQNVIFSRSVRSLLTTPLVFAGASAREAAIRVTDVLRRFDFIYLLDRDYLTLSGGERQFVALFSCLLAKVDLFLLDDPVVMMDGERASKILEVIAECVDKDEATAYGVTSVRPEYYASLKLTDTVRLGYSPGAAGCLRQFDGLLLSLGDIGKGQLVITLEDVTISPYGKVLLERESQQWRSNEVIVITGGNGTGKTCLLQTMAGALKPSSGWLSIASDKGRPERPAIGKNCFYLPQQFTSLLGFDTLFQELGTATAPVWWKEILTFIYDWRILNPDLRVPESSLGERHFCNILAAFSALARSASPAALLLDEPDSGLDALRCQLLTRLLAWIAAQNYFVAVVSHHPDVYRERGLTRLQMREFTITDQRLVLRE
jgi:ABC-type Mn2+/Zn2+ transport system ATPase subunit